MTGTILSEKNLLGASYLSAFLSSLIPWKGHGKTFLPLGPPRQKKGTKCILPGSQQPARAMELSSRGLSPSS